MSWLYSDRAWESGGVFGGDSLCCPGGVCELPTTTTPLGVEKGSRGDSGEEGDPGAKGDVPWGGVG